MAKMVHIRVLQTPARIWIKGENVLSYPHAHYFEVFDINALIQLESLCTLRECESMAYIQSRDSAFDTARPSRMDPNRT